MRHKGLACENVENIAQVRYNAHVFHNTNVLCRTCVILREKKQWLDWLVTLRIRKTHEQLITIDN